MEQKLRHNVELLGWLFVALLLLAWFIVQA
jgi:hypothetical protein